MVRPPQEQRGLPIHSAVCASSIVLGPLTLGHRGLPPDCLRSDAAKVRLAKIELIRSRSPEEELSARYPIAMSLITSTPGMCGVADRKLLLTTANGGPGAGALA
jgi:hypothetical protein